MCIILFHNPCRVHCAGLTLQTHKEFTRRWNPRGRITLEEGFLFGSNPKHPNDNTSLKLRLVHLLVSSFLFLGWRGKPTGCGLFGLYNECQTLNSHGLINLCILLSSPKMYSTCSTVLVIGWNLVSNLVSTSSVNKWVSQFETFLAVSFSLIYIKCIFSLF